MRPRSGALHSETEQQYLILAQKAQGLNGIFYDAKHQQKLFSVYHELKQHHHQKHPHDAFQNFDYSQKEEEDEDLERLEEEVRLCGIGIINVVIVGHQAEILLQLGQDSQKDHRQLDLVIHKKEVSNKQTVFKYWIMNEQLTSIPLHEIYLQKANMVFAVNVQASTLQTLNQKYKLHCTTLSQLKSHIQLFEANS